MYAPFFHQKFTNALTLRTETSSRVPQGSQIGPYQSGRLSARQGKPVLSMILSYNRGLDADQITDAIQGRDLVNLKFSHPEAF